MQPDELTAYLHHQIPLSRAMELEVIEAGAEKVRLFFPLAPNDNHKGTAFGGSLSTAATLAAWALLFVRIEQSGGKATVVIQNHSIDYLAPASDDFVAESSIAAGTDWQRFLSMLQRRGRARIELPAQVVAGGQTVADFRGSFVALLDR